MEPDLTPLDGGMAHDEEIDFGRLTADLLRADLEALIIAAHDCAEALAKQERSRSLSLVITKLDEAEMWCLRLNEYGKETN
jgi:hypothetical protein